MKDKKFIIQLICFLLFAIVFPFAFISFKYDLFKNTQEVKVISTLTIWGFISVCIFACVLVVLIKTYLDGMKTKHSLAKQILKGTIKIIIPLGLIVLLLQLIYNGILTMQENYEEWLKSIVLSLKDLKETMVVVLACETVAIIINPLPKWAFENNVNGMAEIASKILNKGEVK